MFTYEHFDITTCKSHDRMKILRSKIEPFLLTIYNQYSSKSLDPNQVISALKMKEKRCIVLTVHNLHIQFDDDK